MFEMVKRRLNGQPDDRGEVLVTVVIIMIIVMMFSGWMMSMAWLLQRQSLESQRESLAQEAVDAALSQAMFTLNEDYGVVDPTATSDDAYERTIPSEASPSSADMSQFNATKELSLHEVSGGEYGVQAQARWWIDEFDTTYDDLGSATNVDTTRYGNIVGDLYVESRIVSASGEVVFATRAVRMSLYQIQARAVTASSGGGLRYVVSPLALFQYGAFGTDGVLDISDGTTAVESSSQIASSGSIVLSNPEGVFGDLSNQGVLEADMILYGNGQCLEWDASTGAVAGDCGNARTLNTGFEVEPDVSLIQQFEEFCSSSGTDDFIASEQENPMLAAGAATYCFRDFIMDEDVRLVPGSTSGQAVRIFVERTLDIQNGSVFTTASGGSLVDAAGGSSLQAAIFTTSTDVTLQGESGVGSDSKFYLYAPNASCDVGAMDDDPSTTGIDESALRSDTTYYGSFVCADVTLSHASYVANETPLSELVSLGDASAGGVLYPNNLWFINRESTEFAARNDTAWGTP